jgi:hypothetical protein
MSSALPGYSGTKPVTFLTHDASFPNHYSQSYDMIYITYADEKAQSIKN